MIRSLFNKDTDSVVQAYLGNFPRFRGGATTVQEASFIVLDVETTGFDAWHDKIVSIAWVKVVGGELLIESAKSAIVCQPNVDLKDSSAIHGLLHEQLQQGQKPESILAELLLDLSDSIIVGHHVAFDLRMINQSMRTHYQMKLKNRWLDTAELAMKTLDAFKTSGYSNQNPPSLDEVCTYCGITIEDRHTAEGDVLATAQLLLLMLARLQQRQKGDLPLKTLPLRRASSC
ncbi:MULTISPECIES: 3'-5' exonuclease [unclassified Lentimonas]|uniref:3'-5' exonuclease n=1 Tax=unclassified Lentimonas TaxID=2630993 RepID=UPI0013269300|nr:MULTISPECIES: 3'-5' exonuclease [unclassified Lentimonas]CAA6676282.1 Unannotated [Lentimonas sp. CC4]CAA6683828.1 Unannotated [Lentimonas sp. CC6]CAA6692390.1 Unannotated [Lentimonas sp. CC19]CAA6693957.1 Unannotated [Lentimonas sp. CC10]CAA7072208.1 Unannotated [Lentimonas sp. CC11]